MLTVCGFLIAVAWLHGHHAKGAEVVGAVGDVELKKKPFHLDIMYRVLSSLMSMRSGFMLCLIAWRLSSHSSASSWWDLVMDCTEVARTPFIFSIILRNNEASAVLSKVTKICVILNSFIFKTIFCFDLLHLFLYDMVGRNGPHAKGAKVVGAQGDLAIARRLPAAAQWPLLRDVLIAVLDVGLAV